MGRELAERLHALICALIHLYKRGSGTRVWRSGGGYEYESGMYDQEAVDALSRLNSDGWTVFGNNDNPRGLPDGYVRSVSPGRLSRNSMYMYNGEAKHAAQGLR